MKRFIITTTAVAALLTAPAAFAEENPAMEASAVYNSTDTIPRYQTGTSKITKEEYLALVNTIDEPFLAIDGTQLGVVQNLVFDDNGNPAIVIGLLDRTNIDADTLVIKPTSESIKLQDGFVRLNVSADELYERVKAHALKTDSDTVTVIIL